MIPSQANSFLSTNETIQKFQIDANNTVYSGESASFDYTVRKLPNFMSLPQDERLEQLQRRKKAILKQVSLSQVKSKHILSCKKYEFNAFESTFFHQKIDTNLRAFLKKETINYGQIIVIFYQIVEGIKALHNERICYRNLCPENIALKDNEGTLQIMLMNFSKSKKLDNFNNRIQISQYEKNSYLKSIYNAPETSKKNYHFLQCDIWSLGILLYEMLFKEIQNIEVLSEHVIVPFPQETPEWLKDFIEKMLQYDPLKRHKIEDIQMIVRSAVNCRNTTNIKKKML